jgi:DNA polymerase-3 subunit delta'
MEILGNLALRQRLDEALRQAPPAPAYLFLGPRGVGKGLVASWLASRLLCAGPEPPCGHCLACHKVASGNHPDVMVMDRVEGKASLGIDDVREGISAVQLRPYEGGYRLWILAEAERLTDEAQSALLKTLEEPPPHLVLVLVAGGEDALLPTVTSRCRILRFGPVEPGAIADLLVRRGVPPERAAVAARISGGSPGTALTLVGAGEMWELREAALAVVAELPGADMGQALEAAAALESLKTDATDPKADLTRVLEILSTWFRDAACLAVGAGEDLLVNVDRLEALRGLVARSDSQRLDRALRSLLEAGYHLRRNVQPRFLLQKLCLDLARAGR